MRMMGSNKRLLVVLFIAASVIQGIRVATGLLENEFRHQHSSENEHESNETSYLDELDSKEEMVLTAGYGNETQRQPRSVSYFDAWPTTGLKYEDLVGPMKPIPDTYSKDPYASVNFPSPSHLPAGTYDRRQLKPKRPMPQPPYHRPDTYTPDYDQPTHYDDVPSYDPDDHYYEPRPDEPVARPSYYPEEAYYTPEHNPSGYDEELASPYVPNNSNNRRPSARPKKPRPQKPYRPADTYYTPAYDPSISYDDEVPYYDKPDEYYKPRPPNKPKRPIVKPIPYPQEYYPSGYSDESVSHYVPDNSYNRPVPQPKKSRPQKVYRPSGKPRYRPTTRIDRPYEGTATPPIYYGLAETESQYVEPSRRPKLPSYRTQPAVTKQDYSAPVYSTPASAASSSYSSIQAPNSLLGGSAGDLETLATEFTITIPVFFSSIVPLTPALLSLSLRTALTLQNISLAAIRLAVRLIARVTVRTSATQIRVQDVDLSRFTRRATSVNAFITVIVGVLSDQSTFRLRSVIRIVLLLTVRPALLRSNANTDNKPMLITASPSTTTSIQRTSVSTLQANAFGLSRLSTASTSTISSAGAQANPSNGLESIRGPRFLPEILTDRSIHTLLGLPTIMTTEITYTSEGGLTKPSAMPYMPQLDEGSPMSTTPVSFTPADEDIISGEDALSAHEKRWKKGATSHHRLEENKGMDLSEDDEELATHFIEPSQPSDDYDASLDLEPSMDHSYESTVHHQDHTPYMA